MNENWPRWIFASASKHFNNSCAPLVMYVEGTHRNTRLEQHFIEFRMDGPYFTEVSKNYWHVYFEINILVQAIKTDDDFHQIHRDVGHVAKAFTSINIYKFGDGVDDDQSHLACAEVRQNVGKHERIQINHFGQIEPDINLLQSTVEGHYEMYLTT